MIFFDPIGTSRQIVGGRPVREFSTGTSNSGTYSNRNLTSYQQLFKEHKSKQEPTTNCWFSRQLVMAKPELVLEQNCWYVVGCWYRSTPTLDE